MPSGLLPYYEAVAERMLPFLRGRKVVVEQRFPRADRVVYRRHQGSGERRDWIAIDSTAGLLRWARQHAIGFHAHLKPEGPGAWFALDIDSREQPTEQAGVAALHALDLLAEQGLAALVKYSGADGFHLMWNMPSLRGLGGADLWATEREVVQALADRVAARLEDDPRAEPLRAAIGPGRPLIMTSAQDDEHRDALLFDKHILKPNVNVRVPFSIHAATGRAAIPLGRDELERFDDALALPDAVAASDRTAVLPDNDLAAVKRALGAWRGETFHPRRR